MTVSTRTAVRTIRVAEQVSQHEEEATKKEEENGRTVREENGGVSGSRVQGRRKESERSGGMQKVVHVAGRFRGQQLPSRQRRPNPMPARRWGCGGDRSRAGPTLPTLTPRSDSWPATSQSAGSGKPPTGTQIHIHTHTHSLCHRRALSHSKRCAASMHRRHREPRTTATTVPPGSAVADDGSRRTTRPLTSTCERLLVSCESIAILDEKKSPGFGP